MTQISRPFSGTIIGDAGPYSDDDWALTWKQAFGYHADAANRGILRGIDGDLQVTETSPASADVQIAAGAALVQGRWYYSDAAETVTIPANTSGSTRFDAIVLELDATAQTIRIDRVAGTPGGSVPSLIQTLDGVGNVSFWQIPLCYIEVANGFSSIVNADITDWREYANIPAAVGIDVTNQAGSVLESGTLVIWDTGTGGQNVDTTTTEADPDIAGIIERRINASGGTGRIITYGIFPVICDEAVSEGDRLEASTTAGQAQIWTHKNQLPFAIVLTANTGAGTAALCLVSFSFHDVLMNMGWSASASADQTVTATTWTKIAFNTSNFDDLGAYDTTNRRWTAPFACEVHISAGLLGGAATSRIAIYKNGVLHRQASAGFSNTTCHISYTDKANAGDYYEVWGQSGNTSITLLTGFGWFTGHIV